MFSYVSDSKNAVFQTLKNLEFPKERGWGVGDGNTVKLDCDDHCTAINVINSLNNLKKERGKKPYLCYRLNPLGPQDEKGPFTR